MPDRPVPATFPAETTLDSPSRTPGGDSAEPAATVTAPPAGTTFPFLRPPSRPGDLGRLGPYQVLRLLGEGGMGFVFLAEDEALRRPVALKVMRPEVADRPVARERFLREGRAAAAVRSDHVVTVYQVGEDGGVPFLALELLEGESLEAWLRARPGPAPVAMVERVARHALAGLAAAHAKGLVHRDIKPANLWVEAATGRIKVLDFGLTRPAADDAGLTQEGSVLGTPAYMAPEQAAGRAVDGRADLWSLGLVLFRMASGKNPFHRDSAQAALAAVLVEPAPSARDLPGLPADLVGRIDRLLAKDPDQRPRAAGEALVEWGGAGKPPPAGPSERRRLAGLAGAVACLGAGAVIAVALSGGPALPPPPDMAAPAGGPVRVLALDVYLYEGLGAEAVRPRGVLGADAFGATLGDEVEVAASLSRPAYCYLVVFRPDGGDQVLYPQDDTDAPERTERPRYPSKRRDARYALTEGAGLWVVALVATDEPLPPFRKWRAGHPGGPWRPAVGSPGLVLADDGERLDTLAAGRGRVRGDRGEKAADKVPVARLVDWLRAESQGIVSVVGFTVRGRP